MKGTLGAPLLVVVGSGGVGKTTLAATIAVGITRGADLIRVHDVKEMGRVAKMTDALVRK